MIAIFYLYKEQNVKNTPNEAKSIRNQFRDYYSVQDDVAIVEDE